MVLNFTDILLSDIDETCVLIFSGVSHPSVGCNTCKSIKIFDDQPISIKRLSNAFDS
jgi:hypothetical protein